MKYAATGVMVLLGLITATPTLVALISTSSSSGMAVPIHSGPGSAVPGAGILALVGLGFIGMAVSRGRRR